MVKQKQNSKTIRVNNKQTQSGFFKRFSFVFESIFIVLITIGLLWSTRFFDIASFSSQLSSPLQGYTVSELISYTAIVIIGLIILLIRYSLHIRKRMKQQYIAEEEIKRLAFFDSLTNLPNEELCHNRLDHALGRAVRNNSSLAVLSIGIDNFQTVNDQLGHEGGDKLLKQIAKRLSGELRSGDTLARISGVEFIILLEVVNDKEKINAFAEKVSAKLAKCYRIAMREFYITSNMGISIYPSDGEHGKELIKKADSAMRFAKEKGRNQHAFFSKELQDKVNTKNKIAEQLATAMDNDEFFLHYQPIVSAKSNEIIAVEALLRWNNKLLGEIKPEVFIPIAEEIGLIAKIGDWVLVQACQQNKLWHDQGFTELAISINLSIIQFGIINYASTISSALEKTGMAAQYLELEFTEDILMVDANQSRIQLRELGALGVSIALDDFGTGYSSIKYLSTFKLNKLKVDGSFMLNLPDNKTNAMAVKAIIALSAELNLHVTAEGVETSEQHAFLSSHGIDSMQGYHFSKAVDSLGIDKLLQSPPWQRNEIEINLSQLDD